MNNIFNELLLIENKEHILNKVINDIDYSFREFNKIEIHLTNAFLKSLTRNLSNEVFEISISNELFYEILKNIKEKLNYYNCKQIYVLNLVCNIEKTFIETLLNFITLNNIFIRKLYIYYNTLNQYEINLLYYNKCNKIYYYKIFTDYDLLRESKRINFYCDTDNEDNDSNFED